MNIRHAYAIDIGSGAIKIYDRNKDSFLQETNMIAAKDRTTLIAVGSDAFDLFEKTPDDIDVVAPMKGGRIQDVLMMEAVLHTVLNECSGYAGYRPALYFSVPLDMSELERRAYYSIAKKGRFRRARIFFVEKPFADALSVGVPVNKTEGTMIVNIGMDVTEITVIAENRILISRQLDLGGRTISSAIISGVRHRNGLAISQKTAEELKYTLSDLTAEKNESTKVVGIDVGTGLPRDGTVSSYTVSSSVEGVFSEIAGEIGRLLERIPPQIRTVIRKNGICLTGGSTRIPGIDRYLRAKLDYPVKISKHFEYGTVTGMKRIMEKNELKRFAVPAAKRTSGRR